MRGEVAFMVGTLYSTGNSWYAPLSTISMRFFVLLSLLLLLLVFPALFLFIAKLATAIAAGRGTWQLIRNRVGGTEGKENGKLRGNTHQNASCCKVFTTCLFGCWPSN